MKKYIIVFVLLLLLVLGGCKREYVYVAGTTADSDDITSDVAAETTTRQITVESTSEEITFFEEITEEVTSAESAETTESAMTEIDLTIEMPDKNGTMVVDTSSDNKFVKEVNKSRKIGSDKLVAVYSVPESGQNYVFEFMDAKGRKVDDLRRVYLLDENCKITGVAASSSTEKEGISSVENWFCMNVLIKEMIFPAVAEQF